MWTLPLVICNRMMWDFYVPKELFLQFAVFLLLLFRVMTNETSLTICSADVSIAGFLILPGILSVISGRSSLNTMNIPGCLLLYYFLLQSIHFRDNHRIIEYFRLAVSGLFLVGVFMAIYGIMQDTGLDFLHPHGVVTFGPKVVGTIGHANAFGGYLAVVAVLGFAVLKGSKSIIWKIIEGSGIAVIIIAIGLTQSRGAFLALCGAWLFFNFRPIQSAWKKALRKPFALMIGLALLVFGVVVLSRWLIDLNRASVTGRIFVWRITWSMFRDFPLFGIGYRRYPVEYLNYQARFFDRTGHAVFYSHAANMKQADNEYLQFLAENGLAVVIISIALIIILARCLYRLLKNSGQNSSENNWIVASGSVITVVLLHSLVDNPLRTLPTGLIVLFVIGMLSHLIKFDTGSFWSKRIFFTNRLFIPIVAFLLFLLNIYFVVIRGRAHCEWREGRELIEADHMMEGIARYEKAARILSRNGELLFNLGSAYAYIDRPRDALPLLERARQNFNDKNLHIAEGLAYYRLNKPGEAEQSLNTSLRMYPNLMLPRLWLAQLALQAGRRDEAITKLHEILEIQPKVLSEDAVTIKRDAEFLLSRIQNDNPSPKPFEEE